MSQAQNELTIEQLAADIRTLAVEVNNVALTVTALIRILGVDHAALQREAQNVMLEVLRRAEEEAKEEEAPPQTEITRESVEAGGDAAHPANAVFFGG